MASADTAGAAGTGEAGPAGQTPSEIDISFSGRFVVAMPDAIADKLEPEERILLGETAEKVRGAYWTGSHAIDAKYTLAWFSRRFYLRIMAGEETRDPNRFKSDNRNSSIARSAVNVFAIGVGVLLFYLVAGVALLAISAVLE